MAAMEHTGASYLYSWSLMSHLFPILGEKDYTAQISYKNNQDSLGFRLLNLIIQIIVI